MSDQDKLVASFRKTAKVVLKATERDVSGGDLYDLGQYEAYTASIRRIAEDMLEYADIAAATPVEEAADGQA